MYDVLQKVPQALYGCLLIVVGFYVSTAHSCPKHVVIEKKVQANLITKL